MVHDPFAEEAEEAEVNAPDFPAMPSTPMAEALALQQSPLNRSTPWGMRTGSRSRAVKGRRGRSGVSAADSFLEKQSRMLDIQMEHLHEQRGLQLSHLRLRRFNEYLKLAVLILTMLLGAGIVLALGALTLQARSDNALVIDPFRAPPELAQRGLDGTALATQLLDKLRLLQESTDSARAPSSFRNNWGDDIKMEIPETGVSIGDLQRYLRQVLGHETHISGEIFRGWVGAEHAAARPDALYLTVRAGAQPGQTIPGSDSDLDDMVQIGAEKIFAQTQPYRYILYLARNNRIPEALTASEKLATTGAVEDRPWAYAYWGGLLLVKYGDVVAGEEKERTALRLDPDLAIAWHNLAGDELLLGHDESGLRKLATAHRFLGSNRKGELSNSARRGFVPWSEVRMAELVGDYGSAIAEDDTIRTVNDRFGTSATGLADAALINKAAALALTHDVTGSRRLIGSTPPTNAATFRQIVEWGSNLLPFISQRRVLDDWASIVRDFSASEAAAADFPLGRAALPIYVRPWLAYARARTGDQRGAEALIAPTPLDCYLCVRMRGRIAAVKGDWAGAERWFGEAVRQGPSLPFADIDRGEMLMVKGDFDAAVSAFALAHRKGPRFADPLELWGEALMRKGELKGALDRFGQAEPLAPRWGRLQLVWGQALDGLGRRPEALRRYRAAAGMDLSTADWALMTKSGGRQ